VPNSRFDNKALPGRSTAAAVQANRGQRYRIFSAWSRGGLREPDQHRDGPQSTACRHPANAPGAPVLATGRSWYLWARLVEASRPAGSHQAQFSMRGDRDLQPARANSARRCAHAPPLGSARTRMSSELSCGLRAVVAALLAPQRAAAPMRITVSLEAFRRAADARVAQANSSGYRLGRPTSKRALRALRLRKLR
jgi:hypothetical protein